MLSERHALIALNCVAQVGAAKARSLERVFGSVAGAAAVSPEALAAQCPDFGADRARRFAEALREGAAEREEAHAARCSVRILTWADAAYPESLRHSPSPPPVIYCDGDIRLLPQLQVAVIGTRRASPDGAAQAARFAQAFASAGVHVTSGLAEGIDSAAHEGALAAGASGKTVAVLGAALDCVYPVSRKPLARRIASEGGLVVSEYPFGRYADASAFRRRNRVVAALSRALLVAETPPKGGTIFTVNLARGMGSRKLYALPDHPDWPSFAGNQRLIADGQACAVTSPEQILDDLGVTRR